MSEKEKSDLRESGALNRKAWLDSPFVDAETKKAVLAITGEKEITEIFGRELAFGTGGMRGVMGPGNDRMNPYTVRRAILGVARWLRATCPEAGAKGAVIAWDTRHHSQDYAKHAAVTLAEEGVRVYLADRPMPTPVLSWAVREIGCATGVVITASHNTKEFNGMKIYNDGGCQLPPEEALPLMAEIEGLPLFRPLPEADFDSLVKSGKISLLGEDILRRYVDVVTAHSLLEDTEAKAALSVVYTPLNGAGNRYIREALAKGGFSRVSVVPEQEEPDGDFPTVRQPNPEETEALALAIRLAEKTKAHLVVGSDPDSDRLGTAIAHEGEFVNITGNQIGVLLLDYLAERKKSLGRLPEKGVLISTIVSSTMGEVIAADYGLGVRKTLTGFKYIGEQMIGMAKAGGRESFVFGYEESNGYLVGEYARDKDAVGAALLFCEAAAYWLKRGKTMIDRLEELYRVYGYYLDKLDNFVLPGIDGLEKIGRLMDTLRRSGAGMLPGVRETEDYLQGVGEIPKDNVLRFMLEGGSWVAVRPSGTEPKLKVYYSVRGDDKEKAGETLLRLRRIIASAVEAQP